MTWNLSDGSALALIVYIGMNWRQWLMESESIVSEINWTTLDRISQTDVTICKVDVCTAPPMLKESCGTRNEKTKCQPRHLFSQPWRKCLPCKNNGSVWLITSRLDRCKTIASDFRQTLRSSSPESCRTKKPRPTADPATDFCISYRTIWRSGIPKSAHM